MDRITAFVDGSDYGVSVVDYAGWAASRLSMPVSLVHLIGRRETGGAADLSGALALGARSALMDKLSALDADRAVLARERGRAILDGVEARMTKKNPDVEVETKLRFGELSTAMAEAEAQSRFVILGKRGEAAGFDSAHLGSNVDRAVKASTRPVMIANRTFRAPKRFVFAYDTSAAAGRALERMLSGSVLSGLACDIVSVGQAKPQLRERLSHAAGALRQAGYDVTEHLETGDPEAVIAAKVTETDADQLVLGKSARNRLSQMIIGSTTLHLMQTVKVPVVIFP